METYTYAQYEASAQALRQRLGDFRPRVLLILGSGLGALGDAVEDPIVVPYAEVPHMKFSTAPGHKGRFLFGHLAGQRVAVMQGRLHTYEGWSFADVAYPVRVLRLLGAEALVVTNAAGAVNRDFSVGDIMLITDHIKLFGVSPLCGANVDEFGPRFFDVSRMYTPELRKIALDCAAGTGIRVHEGVYMFFTGPQFETPAEIRAARALGADAVGMSTVTEALTAAHCGMPLLALSVMTNMAAGVLDRPLTTEEVDETSKVIAGPFSDYMKKIVAAV